MHFQNKICFLSKIIKASSPINNYDNFKIEYYKLKLSDKTPSKYRKCLQNNFCKN